MVNTNTNKETMTFKQVTSHQYLFRTNVPSMQRNNNNNIGRSLSDPTDKDAGKKLARFFA